MDGLPYMNDMFTARLASGRAAKLKCQSCTSPQAKLLCLGNYGTNQSEIYGQIRAERGCSER